MVETIVISRVVPRFRRVLDFNAPWRSRLLLCTIKWKGDCDARGQAGFCSTDGFHSQAGFRRMCETLSRQLPGPRFLLSRSVPHDGLRSVDLSRKPAGHRNLLECGAVEIVPRRVSRPGFQEHAQRCQQASRLADLRRLRSSAHSLCPEPCTPRTTSQYRSNRPPMPWIPQPSIFVLPCFLGRDFVVTKVP